MLMATRWSHHAGKRQVQTQRLQTASRLDQPGLVCRNDG